MFFRRIPRALSLRLVLQETHSGPISGWHRSNFSALRDVPSVFEIMAENPSGFQMSSSQFDQLAGEIDPHLYEVAHVMDSRE
jgi:hypothetical protein